jgi:hypothetical protein
MSISLALFASARVGVTRAAFVSVAVVSCVLPAVGSAQSAMGGGGPYSPRALTPAPATMAGPEAAAIPRVSGRISIRPEGDAKGTTYYVELERRSGRDACRISDDEPCIFELVDVPNEPSILRVSSFGGDDMVLIENLQGEVPIVVRRVGGRKGSLTTVGAGMIVAGAVLGGVSGYSFYKKETEWGVATGIVGAFSIVGGITLLVKADDATPRLFVDSNPPPKPGESPAPASTPTSGVGAPAATVTPLARADDSALKDRLKPQWTFGASPAQGGGVGFLGATF